MSGHSKWSTIKRQKGVADQKRGQQFTKLANVITIATRAGGSNVDSNFKLRLAVDSARAVNMPKENINRAIERGVSKQTSGSLDEITYEAYAPYGIALLIQAVTDNRQRTTAAIRSLIERAGGSLGSPGSVSWMFKQIGEIEISKQNKNLEEVFLQVVDLGAEDIEEAGESVLIYTDPNNLESVKNRLSEANLEVIKAELGQKPINNVRLEDTNKVKVLLELIEKIEDLEDVQKVYSNFDIEEKLLEHIN